MKGCAIVIGLGRKPLFCCDKAFGLRWICIMKGAAAKDMRTRVTLACTECKNRNYNTTKDKKTHPERMEIKKYCKFCRTHTLHKETK